MTPLAGRSARLRGVVLLAAVSCAACATRVVSISREHLLPTAQTADAGYLDELLAASRRLGLSARPEWHKLLHYQSTWSGGVESQADGPSFFLAAIGKVSPRAELEATLRGLFASVSPGAPKDVQHPICQFPARLLWLTRELHIDRDRLPHPVCDRLDEF